MFSPNPTPPPVIQLSPKKSKRWWKIPLLLILMLILAFLIAVGLQTLDLILKYRRGEIDLATLTGQPSNQPLNINVATTDDPYLGSPNAKIIIVEFGDFTCPICKKSYPIIRQLYQLYPRDIKIIFRDFPVLSEMSITAALAGECAKEQGSAFFWALHDKMFDNQDKLSVELIKQLASQLQLDTNRFNQCLDTEKYKTEVSQDLDAASTAGASGTPTFFINGEKISGFQELESWKKAVNYLLQHLK